MSLGSEEDVVQRPQEPKALDTPFLSLFRVPLKPLDHQVRNSTGLPLPEFPWPTPLGHSLLAIQSLVLKKSPVTLQEQEIPWTVPPPAGPEAQLSS